MKEDLQLPRPSLTCMVFSGRGGFLMMCLLGAATVVGFILIYYYKHFTKHTERRHPKIFFLDLSKMLIATGVAAAVNYTFTAKVSLAASHVTVRGKQLEGIGWYAAMCTTDVALGVPISIVIGRLINRASRCLLNKLPPRTPLWDLCEQNVVYGKYSPSYDASQSYLDASPPIWMSWWYSQTVTWTCACVFSVFISGLVVLGSFELVQSVNNPMAWIAVGITFWNVSCLLKQWIVVTFTRVVLYYLHLAIIDIFNKYSPANGA